MALFNPGQIVVTRGVADWIEQGFDPLPYLLRHLRGDWGDVDAHDKLANDHALKDGDRLLSAYKTEFGKLWLITEWDRSVTTLLKPDEY